MGASNFHVYYGLRFDLTDADLTPYSTGARVESVPEPFDVFRFGQGRRQFIQQGI
jgi:hypothetical protein